MLNRLKKHIAQNFPFLQNQKLLITVSGGIDSVVLTHLLHNLGYSITIAHCNFQLRGNDSDLDQKFVASLAQELNLDNHTTTFDTETYCKKNKVSTQIGARELRYNWFQQLCKTEGFDYILTAHHLNDSLETFFINLSRGTGIEGLTGIPAINNNIVRPLLIFTRDEIETYAQKKGITWREDKSNAETKYLRNKIRHNITPLLKELHPEFEANFLRSITHLYESKTFIQKKITELKKTLFKTQRHTIHIKLNNLKNLDSSTIFHLFKEFGFTQTEEIKNLIDSQTGKKLLSESYQLLKNRDEFIISKHNESLQKHFVIENIHTVEQLPISLHFNLPSETSIEVAKEKIQFPLILRKREDGDLFFPNGMHGKKKLSKYFKDLKLSQIQKDQTWLLCNADNQIIWVIGHRQDRRFIGNGLTISI